MSTPADLAAIEKEVDSILEKAKTTASKIVDDARRKAREIMQRRIPVEEYEKEAQEIIENARRRAEEIIREAEEKAVSIKNIDSSLKNKAVEKTVKLILGV